jgi:putative ABC transport system permease protein
VLFTREGLSSTGIVTDISRVTERVLLKIPETTDTQSLRARLESAFGPRARITDYTETNPTLTRALDRSTRFLAMVSLVALIVGGLGVGATVQSHLRQKMTNIAFMKCVGGQSRQIIRIYMTQACLLGLSGSLLGALTGAIAQSVFARIVSGFFDVPITLIWPIAAMAQGTAAGLLTVALFSLPPLLAIRKIRPMTLLQRNFEESRSLRSLRERLDIASVAAAVAAVVGLWAIAIWVSASLRYASGFAASLLAGLLLLGIAGRLMLAVLRRASRLQAVTRNRALRHGIANLYRPGAHAVAVLTSLGLGVMFTTSVYLVQYSLLEELRLAAPPDSPNVFLVNITEREQAGITAILQSDSNITHRPALSPSVSSTLVSVDGTPAAELTSEAGARRFANTVFVLTWSRDLPAATTVLEGEWWEAEPSEPLVSVNETAADALGIHVGSVVEWSAAGTPIRARVANIRRTDGFRTGVNNQFILSPGTLDGLATAYFGAVRVLPHGIGPLQVRVFASYPTVTVVNAADILEVVQNVMDKTSQAIRFVAGFAIAGGLIVLATSVAGTRQRRMREVAIFRTVGATRGALIRIFSAEFAAIGIVAGALGSLLASALAAALAVRMFDTPYRLQIVPTIVATVVTAVLTVTSGWLASRGSLSRKPLDILRSSE